MAASKNIHFKQQALVSNGMYLGLAAIIVFFVGSGWFSYLNTKTLEENTTALTHSQNVLLNLSELLSLLKDAETGQRGYVITGDAEYLEPYDTAVSRIKEKFTDIKHLVQGSLKQTTVLPLLRERIDLKLQELAETIELRRTKGFEQAKEIVVTNRGKRTMDHIRAQVDEMQLTERELRQERIFEMENAYRISIGSGISTGLLGVVLSIAVTYLLRRSLILRDRNAWLQTAQIRLGQVIAGDHKMVTLCQNTLNFLTNALGAQAGSLYVEDGDFRRQAIVGVPNAAAVPVTFTSGDGPLGQATREQRTIVLHDVPPGQLPIGSALSNTKLCQLLIVPLLVDGHVYGVAELVFLHPLSGLDLEFFERISETLGVAVRSVKYRENQQRLLEETQRQSHVLQEQREELRMTNEELDLQGRALRESQIRLETQRAQLELVDQNRSDFLAKISQELRTPLSSALVLAKRLADNPSGNLTVEQVQLARTIHRTGNELLASINEIMAP
ncbi:MAG: CHASE3 domain-containing protein [Pirellulales bacterium]